MLPLFKSHYSLGASILTLKPRGESEPDEPDSIIDICYENNVKDFFLVEDSITGLLEADKNARAANLNLRYGLRLSFVDNSLNKDAESLKNECKFVIFVKNQDGVKDLYKISSKANSKDCFYYNPRFDFKLLKEFWSDNLILAVPFYDSFIYNNTLSFSGFVPDFSFTKPVFFVEDNKFMFDKLIQKKVIKYTNKEHFETIKSKSIYYKDKKDFPAYMAFKCIKSRSTFDKPEQKFCHTDEFCFESYLEQINV